MASDKFQKPQAPLPPGLPQIGYVLLWYPLFTQPFIFREVESLRQHLPLQVYTLYGRNLRHCSREMIQASTDARTFGVRQLGAVLAEFFVQLFTRPRRLFGLMKRSLFRRWSSLEVFGENLWGFLVGLSLGRAFREGGIDLAYAPWPRGAATAAWVGANLAGIPWAVAARGDNLEPADADLAAKLDAALFVRANNRADQTRIENFGQGEAQGKTVLMYNSLTLPQGVWRPSPRANTVRLLAVGRFDVTKGFDVLLKACAILKAEQFPFSLTLAGGGGKVMGLGKQEAYLRDLIVSLGLEADVSLPGLVSHDELPLMFNEHDIFVAPCVVDSSGRRDGIPNTVIEAMSRGLPVISTTVNALPEVVMDGKTGLAVSPGDEVALARAIKKMAANPEIASQMGADGAALAAEMFDPEKNAARMADIFIEYLKRARTREEGACAE